MTGNKIMAAALLAALSTAASAATFNFAGDIANHNDVITTTFTLDAPATNVRVWTDSFMDGINFDPITALWNATTGARIAEDDDNDTINPATQTYYDSGFLLATLDAGTYFFTVAAYNNWSAGSNIADGFSFDGQAPVPLSQWCQPASHCDMGTHWSVWLDGVSSATNPDDPNDPTVPEPASLALVGLGLAGLALRRKQQR